MGDRRKHDSAKEKNLKVSPNISTLPPKKLKLREMRACLRKAAPGARESLKWGVPAFSCQRILFTFAAFKHHIGFYPTPSAVKAFARDLPFSDSLCYLCLLL